MFNELRGAAGMAGLSLYVPTGGIFGGGGNSGGDVFGGSGSVNTSVGGGAANSAIGIIGALGNIIVGTTQAVRGNYPPTARVDTYVRPVVPVGYRYDTSGALVADTVGQAAGDATQFITRNLGLIVVGGVGLMLFKSGRR